MAALLVVAVMFDVFDFELEKVDFASDDLELDDWLDEDVLFVDVDSVFDLDATDFELIVDSDDFEDDWFTDFVDDWLEIEVLDSELDGFIDELDDKDIWRELSAVRLVNFDDTALDVCFAELLMLDFDVELWGIDVAFDDTGADDDTEGADFDGLFADGGFASRGGSLFPTPFVPCTHSHISGEDPLPFAHGGGQDLPIFPTKDPGPIEPPRS